MPIILAGIFGLSTGDTSTFIQMSFLLVLFQLLFKMVLVLNYLLFKVHLMFLGALAAIGANLSLGAMIGSLIPGEILFILMGYFKILSKIV